MKAKIPTACCNKPMIVVEWHGERAQVKCPHGCRDGWTHVVMKIESASSSHAHIGDTTTWPEIKAEPVQDEEEKHAEAVALRVFAIQSRRWNRARWTIYRRGSSVS